MTAPFSFILQCIALAKDKRHGSSPSEPDLSEASFGYTSSTESTAPLSPYSLSEMEATQYYAGLPSSPRLLARTGTTPWERTEGPEASRKLKQLGVVINHKLNTGTVWEYNVAPKVHACLDEMGVKWTSTDIVRIGEVGDDSPPVILWIGVKPKSLAGEDANNAAFMCLNILNEFDITDVEVEIRESSVIRSAGPKLLPPVPSSHPTVDVHYPVTHALGLPISAQATPFIGGTGGFFMSDSSDNNKLLLITARHVVLPLNKANDRFERKNTSKPRFNVLLLGDEAYENCLASIKARIGVHGMMVEKGMHRIDGVMGRDDERAEVVRVVAQREIDEAEEAMEALYTLYNNVKKNWATAASRVLGHVVCSPPIRLGAGTAEEQYTEDYAIIEIDNDKINWAEFKGNAIDLGTRIPSRDFSEKMHDNPQNPRPFKYPRNRLLELRGTISEHEMRHPTILGQDEESCLLVIKNGSATGVTIGRANGIMSFVREYFDDGSDQTSKEWSIISYDKKSGVFSAPGDSGAVVVDGQGRIGGLLTGGTRGLTDSLDITYVTPISFLLKSIKANGFPKAYPKACPMETEALAP